MPLPWLNLFRRQPKLTPEMEELIRRRVRQSGQPTAEPAEPTTSDAVDQARQNGASESLADEPAA